MHAAGGSVRFGHLDGRYSLNNGSFAGLAGGRGGGWGVGGGEKEEVGV